jgi:NADPH:quinone reductase-like Zn-dependent oxidoreductase
MKAVLLDAPGPPSSLRIGELVDPAPSPDEVLVRVHAASLNPVDFKVAAVGSELWNYPHVLGVDAAGVIEQVGLHVSFFFMKPGTSRCFPTSNGRLPSCSGKYTAICPKHNPACGRWR